MSHGKPFLKALPMNKEIENEIVTGYRKGEDNTEFTNM